MSSFTDSGPSSDPRRLTNRNTNRYSVNQLYSMAAENDTDIEDDLSRAQKRLRDLKARISAQSKKNFVLERDVRYLDSRIALLIQNRMALDEQNEVQQHLEEIEPNEGAFPPERRLTQYSNLFFLLQSEPRHIASLCRLVSLSEIDTLLQTVMFTLYGNQYESREEHLLLTMFQSVLSAQFETATEFGSLLRANTPVSRMMTTYTRRGPGQSYLKSVLSDRINGLIEHRDLNLEINPLKVYEQMVTQIEEETGTLPPNLPRGVPPETAAANPDVQAIIAPRLTMLMEIANSFLLTIIESMESAPYGIRWICKQIRSLTRRKYPDATDYAICSLIGGFFFLRFVNPAVVTPQAFMLVDGVPAKHPRRTLTLIAKMLQNLANKPSYAKEQYMSSLNPFVENNKARINLFLNNLCEVGDFYDTLETICDHNNYLRGQLEQYKAYLQNVRFAADKGAAGGVGVLAYGGKERRQPKTAPQGPVRYTHAQLEKEGIIVESNVPDNRRPNIYFNISSPTPGTFIIALHYKGREKAILEMDLKIDDLLEKQKDNKHLLDLEYVQLNVPKVLALLNKIFSKKK
ncbi:glyceraldehyde-3-phosphate dehydrogenase 1 [Serendipita sp. 398]|nr:glyceraldehyde-3-phosphate dehydrogenase 1 [Serendipita sp. 398]